MRILSSLLLLTLEASMPKAVPRSMTVSCWVSTENPTASAETSNQAAPSPSATLSLANNRKSQGASTTTRTPDRNAPSTVPSSKSSLEPTASSCPLRASSPSATSCVRVKSEPGEVNQQQEHVIAYVLGEIRVLKHRARDHFYK